MKKLFYTLIALLTMTATQSNAQEVFNSVLESAQNALKDPVQNFSKTQIAKFKIDAGKKYGKGVSGEEDSAAACKAGQ